MKTLPDLEARYDLELDRIEKEIKKSKAKRILLQFPDGLKPYATAIVSELEKRTNNKTLFFIWLGSCYGACDAPNIPDKLEFDLLIQFGHSEWNSKETH